MLLSIHIGPDMPRWRRKMADPKITIPQDKVVDFCQRNQIRTFSLFGSVLREDFGPDSDVDVLVEFEPEARVGFVALGRMQRELAELLGRQVDVVPRDGLKPLIRDSVLESAQVLYAA
jgi:predicted nucleotidyltransferase